MMTAAAYGHTQVTSLLLAKGADVDLAESDGGTPRFYATINGYAEVATRLLHDKYDKIIQSDSRV